MQPDIWEFAFKKFPVCADKACLRTTAATFVGNNTSSAISSSSTQCWISPPFSKHNLGYWEFRWGHGSSRLHDLLSAIQSWKTAKAQLTTALQGRSNYLCILGRKPGRNPLIPKTFPLQHHPRQPQQPPGQLQQMCFVISRSSVPKPKRALAS